MTAAPLSQSANSLLAQKRARQIFQYLEELNRRRNPIVRQVRDQPFYLFFRELPVHPVVDRVYLHDDADEPRDGVVIRVGRADIPPPLPVPELLSGWLIIDGNDPKRPPEIKPELSESELSSQVEAEGEQPAERFTDVPERVVKWEEFKADWSKWADEVLLAKAARALFERLYTLYGEIDREGERREIILGDGNLSWRKSDGGMQHPLLLQKLQLEFETDKPEFILREAETPVELYSALFGAK